MPSIKISALTEKATMAGTEEVLINDSGTSKKFSTQRFLDIKTASETAKTAAETAETNAETAETNASGSATSASGSATTATAQAVIATTKAGEASTSATSASGSASTATTQATSATSSATSATASATTATTQAATATTKASEASTSATNAATSATASATSATAAATSATASATSKTAAETAETNAETAQTAAETAKTASETAKTASQTAKTAAETAETNAETAETNAETAETNAESSKTAAASSASTATTQAGIATTKAATATTKASEASTSATNAAASATTATTKAATATTQATAASGSATSASSSASSATTAQSAAEAARDSALAAFDSFDDRYLGQKSSAPTLDNDGNALVAGTLYFNTTSDAMFVYEGSAWVAAYASLSGALLQTNNLSDLNSAGTARTNLGLAALATLGSVAAGQIDANSVGASELNVSGNGTSGQYLGSDADGTFTWTSISADPTMGGDLSGTASNAQLGSNVVTDTELNSAKLNGIESGATADQTNAQIKTAYEANADSNEFSDAEQTKLSGIATSANNYSLPSSVVHDTEKGALHATDALRLSGHTVSLYKGDGTSESVTIPDNNTTYSVGDGGLTQKNFTTADNTKLDGISTSANNYSLPTATASTYGGVKVSLSGTHLTITA